MDLRTLLATLVASGLGGTAAYWLLEKWSWFSAQASENKRYIAMALNAVVGVLAYLAMIGMGWQSMPINWRDWIEAVANIVLNILTPASLAYVTSQVWHAKKDLAK